MTSTEVSSLSASEPSPVVPDQAQTGALSDAVLNKGERVLLAATDTLLGVVLVADVAVVTANVILRTFFDYSITSTEEISQLALSVLAFVGAASAYARGQHPALDIVTRHLTGRAARIQSSLVEWITVGTAVAILVTAIPIVQADASLSSPGLPISQSWFVLPVCVGMGLVVVFALLRLWFRHAHRCAAIVGAVCFAVVILFAARRGAWTPIFAAHIGIVLPVAFAALLLAGVPIAFVLAAVAYTYMWVTGTVPTTTLATTLNDGITSDIILVAIPFFIFAGFVLADGEMSKRITEFLFDLLGHLRGGIQEILVAAMIIFSGISGAKSADIAAVGSAMRKPLAVYNVPPAETAAILCASASMGETIPPSIAILILASITNLSVGSLFIAGLLPAGILALALVATIYVFARRSRKPTLRRAPVRAVTRSFGRGLLPLLMPLFLILGIVEGIATPSEVSALAVVYGILVSIFLRRGFSLGSFTATVRRTVAMSGMVLFVTSCAASFSWVLAIENIEQFIANTLRSLPGGAPVFLVVAALVLVVMGSVFEGLPAILIFAPILLPVAAGMGINDIHFAIVLIMAMGIGCFAPPIGVGFYVACTIVGASVSAASRAMLPYFVVLIIGLLVVALVPALTL